MNNGWKGIMTAKIILFELNEVLGVSSMTSCVSIPAVSGRLAATRADAVYLADIDTFMSRLGFRRVRRE